MKLKKIEGIMLVVGFGALLLGLTLFFVIPLLVGAGGFEYVGIDVFLAGCKSVFSFNFNKTVYTLLLVIGVVTLLCVIAWAIIIGVNKHKKHYIPLVFVFIAMALLVLMLFSYFVAESTFNGKSGVLFNSIMNVEGQLTGKLLSMLVLACLHISLMFLTLYAFLDIATLILGDKKVEPAVITESIANELPVDPMEGFDDRKAREEALFKSCIETGDFTQYDELEFAEPLEEYKEEPVFEEVEVEEESKVIKRTTYVTAYKEVKVEIK